MKRTVVGISSSRQQGWCWRRPRTPTSTPTSPTSCTPTASTARRITTPGSARSPASGCTNGLDTDANKSAQFIHDAAAEGQHHRAGVAVPRRSAAHATAPTSCRFLRQRRNSKENNMLRKASIAVAALELCGDDLSRASRPPTPPTTTRSPIGSEDHLHRRSVHGRRSRHRSGVLRAVHDRLQQPAGRRSDRAPATGSTGSSRWTTRAAGSTRRTPRPTSTTSSWRPAGATGPSCSSTTRASPRTAPTSA